MTGPSTKSASPSEGPDDAEKRLTFLAHTLRHTFLRKLAQAHGVAFAMQMSGHASSKYIWRYVKPSNEHTEAALEDLC